MSEQSSSFKQTVHELDERFYSVFPLAKPPHGGPDFNAHFTGEAFRFEQSDEAYAPVQAHFQPSAQHPQVPDTVPSLAYYYPPPTQDIASNDLGSFAYPTSVQAVDVPISQPTPPENQPGPSTQFFSPRLDSGHFTSAAHLAYPEPSTSNQVQEQATRSYRPYSDINANHPITTPSPPLQSPVNTRSPPGRVLFLVESPSTSPINELSGRRESVTGHAMVNHGNSIANALQAQYPTTTEPQEPSTSPGPTASHIPQSPRQQGYSSRPVPPFSHVSSPDKVPVRGSAWLEPQAGPSTSSRPSMRLSPLPSKRQLEKKPPLACLFCRGRKIACGPPLPGSRDKTCNQCQRRSLRCEYPAESRRGMRKKKTTDSADKGASPSSTDNAGTESP